MLEQESLLRIRQKRCPGSYRLHSREIHRSLALTFLLAMVCGCNGSEQDIESGESTRVGEPTVERYGLLSVALSKAMERDHDGPFASFIEGHRATAAPFRLEGAVHFARHNIADLGRLTRLLALPVGADADDFPPMDHCVVRDLTAELAADDAARENATHVELVEAGTVTITQFEAPLKDPSREFHPSRTRLDAGAYRRKRDAPLILAPKHFPELVPFVSGVVYDQTRAEETRGHTEIQSDGSAHFAPDPNQIVAPTPKNIFIRVENEGSAQIGKFSISGPVPEIPADIRFTTHQRGGDAVEIHWRPASKEHFGEKMYLELSSIGEPNHRFLRCSLRDDGHYILPKIMIEETTQRAWKPSITGLNIELGRLTRHTFRGRGLDRGHLLVNAKIRIQTHPRER